MTGRLASVCPRQDSNLDLKSTRLNSSHVEISYAVFCLNDTAPTEIYTLSLHDALPICCGTPRLMTGRLDDGSTSECVPPAGFEPRSEEHTSELQSRRDLVCRLLFE